MMDSTQTAVDPSAPNHASDADVNNYMAGRLQQMQALMPPPVDSNGAPGGAPPPGPRPPPTPAVDAPSWNDELSAAEKANGGKPLEPDKLQDLSNAHWARSTLPSLYLANKTLPVAKVAALKNAYDANFKQFADQYHAKNGAAVPPSSSAAADFLKSAAGSIGQGLLEAGRYIPGGIAATTDDLYNAVHGTTGNPQADAYFDWYNKNVDTPGREDALKKMQSDAAASSPVSAFVGQLPGAIASGGTLPALNAVANERDAGGTIGQQEATLGLNTAANLAGMGIGGGLTGTLGRRLLKGGLANTALGVGQTVGSNLIDPKNNPIDAKNVAMQVALGTALGELGHQVNTRVAANKFAGAEGHASTDPAYAARKAYAMAGGDPTTYAPGMTPPNGETTQAKTQFKAAAAAKAAWAKAGGDPKAYGPAPGPVDLSGKPVVDSQGKPVQVADGIELPTNPNVPTGAGIPDAQHAKIVAEASSRAATPAGVATAKLAATRSDAAAEIVATAQNTAKKAAGPAWDAMTPLQQHAATEAAAVTLNRVAKAEGVPGLLDQQRQAATAAGQPTPTVTETGQPDIQGQAPGMPGAPPQAAPQSEPGAPAEEVPGQESGEPLTPHPELGQNLAAEAMGGDQAASPLDTAPKDPLDQTAAQADTLQNKQLHSALDQALTKIRKGVRTAYPTNKLAKMTLEEKYAAYQKETTPTPSATKSEAVPGETMGNISPEGKISIRHRDGSVENVRNPARPDVEAAAAKVDAPGINKINDLGHPRQLGEPLSSKTPVVTTKDVHLAGGVSQDGNTIYIDQRMPKYVNVGGRRINVHEAVALHERVEWPLMKEMGAVYHDAHDAATAAENHFIRQKYGVDPLKYQDALKAAIKKAGIENRHPSADIPADLDSQPNVDLGDTAPLEGKVVPQRAGLRAKKAPAPVEANPLEPTASSEAADVVGQTLEGKVTPADLADVRTMVERAQNGLPEDLHARIHEMREDDVITANEAKALRQAGRETPRNTAERDTGVTKAVDAGHEELLEDAQRSEPPTTDLGRAADEVARAADEIPTGLKSDRARAAETIAKLRKLFPDSPNHQKGIDFLAWTLGKNPALIRTIKGVARTPEGVNYGGRFGSVSRILELVDRKDMAPNTAVHELMHAAESLLPQPIRDAVLKAREAEINRLAPQAAPAEKAMFEYLQNGLKASSPEERALYMQGAKDELLHLRDSQGATGKRIGELYSLVNSSEYWAVHATDMLQEGYLRKGLWAQAHQWLKGFIEQIRSLFSGNPNRDAIINGLQHIMGTQETGTQSFLRDYELTKERYAGQPDGLTPVAAMGQLHDLVMDAADEHENQIERSRDIATKFEETVADQKAFLFKAQEGLRRILGVDAIKQAHDLVDAARLLSGDRGWLVKKAMTDYGHTFEATFAAHSDAIDIDPVRAADKLGMFTQARHTVEALYPEMYRREVPLNNGEEMSRQELNEQLKNLTIAPKEYRKQMTDLVRQNASQPFNEWAHSKYGKLFEQYKSKLKELTDQGVRAAVEKHFDGPMQAINEESIRLNHASGRVATDDPYIEANGFPHYVPLRGHALDGTSMDEAAPTDDFGSIRRPWLNSGNIAKEMKTVKGRATWAQNSALSLLSRMQEAARGVADGRFTKTLLDTVTAHGEALQTKAETLEKALGAETNEARKAALAKQLQEVKASEFSNTTVRSFTGTPRDGYDDIATGQHYDEMPKVPNSVVHHEGREHYLIQFPENSDTYRGLQAINTNYDPREFPMIGNVLGFVEHQVHKVTRPLKLGEPTHLIGKSTAFIARTNTVFNPVFTVGKLLLRLLQEKGVMFSIQNAKGPIDSGVMLAKVYANYLGGVFHKGTGEALVLMLKHDNAGLRALGAKDPDSFAGLMMRMNEAGASTEFNQEITMHEQRNVLVMAALRKQQNLLFRGVRAGSNALSGLADIAENIPSVGIFRYLTQKGMSDREAAARVKGSFDLQQRGTAGKAINGVHAFYRIGATAGDNYLRAFRHPLGLHTEMVMGRPVQTSVDWAKLAKFGSAWAGVAFASYLLQAETLGNDDQGKSRMSKIMSMDPTAAVEHTFIGNGTDSPFSYPTGLGATQFLTAPGTLMAAVARKDITIEQAADAYGHILMRNIPLAEGNPVPKDAGLLAHLFAIGMGAVTPTAAQPGVGLEKNLNSFGEPIHTTHDNPALFAADQGKTNTPEMWKEIAQSLREHTGEDFYPETLQFLSENYMGSVPTDLLRSTLGQTSRAAVGLPNNTLESVLKLTQDTSYYDSSHVYQVSKELNESLQQLDSIRLAAGPKGSPAYEEAGQQWLSSNPDAQKKLVALNQLTAAQKTYQAGLKALVNSKDGLERKQYNRKKLDSALRTATDAAEKTL